MHTSEDRFAHGLAQFLGDEHDGTEKSQEESSSFEILGTEDHTEAPQCTIQISCIPKSVSTEFLQIYFESAKRSGGGVVIDVEHSEGDEMAFLTYEKEEGILMFLAIICKRQTYIGFPAA